MSPEWLSIALSGVSTAAGVSVVSFAIESAVKLARDLRAERARITRRREELGVTIEKGQIRLELSTGLSASGLEALAEALEERLEQLPVLPPGER